MSLKILVVEDNLDTLWIYCRAIIRRTKPDEVKKDGQSATKEEAIVEVEQSDSVSDALSKLRSGRYDLLVVDLKIPGTTGEEMGGLEVIRESLTLDPLRPVIVITGFGTIQLVRDMLTQGVFDFIEKSPTAVDDLVRSVQRAIKSRNEKIVRSGNPFIPTSVEPTVFGGRTAELEFFEQRLDRVLHGNHSEHFLVLGNWGIGKSTLLKEFRKICQSRGHIASMVQLEPFQTGSKLIDVARSIIEGILRDLPFSVDRFKRISKFFDSVGINVLGTGLQLSRDTTKRDLSPQSFLFDSLMNLWEDIQDKSDVFIILLDDLDNCALVPEIVMTLKQTLSLDAIRTSKILIGISSTHANWYEITATKRHHPLSRYFLARIELNPLSETEMRETVVRSLAGTGVSFSPEIISRVFEYTMFFPLENRTLFRLKIAHLFAPITGMFPLGSHNFQSIQEERKGDSNGRLGNNKDPQSKESCNEFARDLTLGADQPAYRQERTGEYGGTFIPEGVFNDWET